ncbi:MAG TPA: shikimate dehydrogenase, partial [Actinomycetes bacterium]|nr:shikimate dehydrogenase [Actinomycetes bacterium]
MAVPVAAVLGWPLAHTLSPALHQAAYRAAGLDGWTYEPRPTRPEDLAA